MRPTNSMRNHFYNSWARERERERFSRNSLVSEPESRFWDSVTVKFEGRDGLLRACERVKSEFWENAFMVCAAKIQDEIKNRKMERERRVTLGGSKPRRK